MDASKHLKRRFASALFTLLMALLAVVAATFAWYIYHTSARTIRMHMAAGSGMSLEISNDFEDGYGYAVELKAAGKLNPVSTDKISGGFQKVTEFTAESKNSSRLLASFFEPGDNTDYYKTSLYLRTSSDKMTVYLSDIGYSDNDELNPISTAIRVGLVPHLPGKDTKAVGEYIFEINDKNNTDDSAGYNTLKGEDGHVLDSSKRDGSTVPFDPYYKDNFCNYDTDTGIVSLKPNSIPICTVEGDKNGRPGTPVELTIYIWLEGCDRDCTRNLCDQTLSNLALSFAGYSENNEGEAAYGK